MEKNIIKMMFVVFVITAIGSFVGSALFQYIANDSKEISTLENNKIILEEGADYSDVAFFRDSKYAAVYYHVTNITMHDDCDYSFDYYDSALVPVEDVSCYVFENSSTELKHTRVHACVGGYSKFF